MVKGWQHATLLTVLEVGQRFWDQGIQWCVLTDIKRDGVSTGVDVSSAISLQKATGLQVVASGGVSTIDDVNRALKFRVGRRDHWYGLCMMARYRLTEAVNEGDK